MIGSLTAMCTTSEPIAIQATADERLVALKEQVLQATNHNEYDKEFLLHIDTFLNDCLTSLFLLDTPTFDQWIADPTSIKALCHQDYAAGNLAIGTDGHIYVYDMDSLTVDLPIRDIRKILNKVMKKNTWDLERMIIMMKAYHEVNPLTKEQFNILVADLLFSTFVLWTSYKVLR